MTVLVTRRHVDYVAICAVSQEAGIAAHKAPDGFLAALVDGRTPPWLEAVPAKEATALRLWRVVRPSP